MRKNSGIIFVFFAIFIMLSVPAISAVQYKTSINSIEQKLNALQAGDHVIDFANIYLLICMLLITVLYGKPSIARMAFNALTIQEIVYEFRTGELIPRCPKFYAGLIGMPILVLAAFIYSKNKVLGTIAQIIAVIIYELLIVIASNSQASSTQQ